MKTCVVGADPKGVLRIFEDVPYPNIAGSVWIEGIEIDKTHSVETDQPGLRAEIKIAVRALTDRAYGRLRQPLLGLPYPVHVLSEGSVRIQAPG